MIIITTLVTLLPILLGIILWEKLPDSIATHWGADGQANGWSNKAFAVFGLPCILAVTHLFSVCITLNDPKRKNIHKKPLTLIFWIMPIVSLVTCCFPSQPRKRVLATATRIVTGAHQPMLVLRSIMLSPWKPEMGTKLTCAGVEGRVKTHPCPAFDRAVNMCQSRHTSVLP